MKAELLRQRMEEGFDIGEPTDQTLSVTGEPYTEVYGIGEENAALSAFKDYARDREGKLYWRVTPEIGNGKFYMRLLISETPAKGGK